MQPMKRDLLPALISVLGVLCAGLIVLVSLSARKVESPASGTKEQTVAETETTVLPSAPAEESRLVLTFLGGVCPGSFLGADSAGTFTRFVTEGAPGFVSSLSPLFSRDAATFCALGSVITDRALLPVYPDETPYYPLRAVRQSAAVLAESGLDYAALTDPHLSDYGQEGLTDTKTALSAAGIGSLGSGEKAVFSVNGADVTVLTISTDKMAPDDLPLLVAEERAKCRFLILYDCCSREPENARALSELYRTAAAAGADLIVGVHGRTLLSRETAGSSVIYPALGAFLSEQGPVGTVSYLTVTLQSENGVLTAVPELKILHQDKSWTYHS